MEMLLTAAVVGVVLGACAVLLFRSLLKRRPPTTRVSFNVEAFKEVGEIVAYKLLVKELVDRSNPAFGPTGQKWFGWFMSEGQMIVILDLQIDYSYDLRSDDFRIARGSAGDFVVSMPVCQHHVIVRDIKFRREQGQQVLPLLLPGALAKALGRNISIDERNQIISDAKSKAGQLAQEQAEHLKGDIQRSAEKTIGSIARGFGAERVRFDFKTPDRPRQTVDVSSQLAA